MMLFLLLFTPGLIASIIYCRQKNVPTKSFEFFVFSLLFTFLIFLFNLGVLYIRGFKTLPLNTISESISNAIKVGIIGLIAAIAFPNLLLFGEKIFSPKKKKED